MSSESNDTLWARFVAGQVAIGARPLFLDPPAKVKDRSLSLLAKLETIGIQPIRVTPTEAEKIRAKEELDAREKVAREARWQAEREARVAKEAAGRRN